MAITMPAVCDSCGTSFSSGFAFDGNSRQITFQNCGAGPCPRCGGLGRIQDGTYDFYDEVKRIIRTAKRPADDIQKFKALVESVANGSTTLESTSREIADAFPEFKSIWAWLQANGSIAGWLSLMLAIIVGLRQKSDTASVQPIISNNINNYYCQAKKEKNPPKLAKKKRQNRRHR